MKNAWSIRSCPIPEWAGTKVHCVRCLTANKGDIILHAANEHKPHAHCLNRLANRQALVGAGNDVDQKFVVPNANRFFFGLENELKPNAGYRVDPHASHYYKLPVEHDCGWWGDIGWHILQCQICVSAWVCVSIRPESVCPFACLCVYVSPQCKTLMLNSIPRFDQIFCVFISRSWQLTIAIIIYYWLFEMVFIFQGRLDVTQTSIQHLILLRDSLRDCLNLISPFRMDLGCGSFFGKPYKARDSDDILGCDAYTGRRTRINDSLQTSRLCTAFGASPSPYLIKIHLNFLHTFVWYSIKYACGFITGGMWVASGGTDALQFRKENKGIISSIHLIRCVHNHAALSFCLSIKTKNEKTGIHFRRGKQNSSEFLITSFECVSRWLNNAFLIKFLLPTGVWYLAMA